MPATESIKATKPDAKYTPNGTVAEHCGICRNYVAVGECRKVEGTVALRGWCRFFAKKVGR